VDTFIANGAECEPLLCNDGALMLLKTEELMQGLELAARATVAKRKIVAVKGKNRDVLSHLRDRTSSQSVELYSLHDYYPAGDEQEIVREATGRTVPEAGIPIDVGVVVQNIETLVNLSRALDGKPVTRRVLTVVGEVARPGIVEAPIGMTAREIIEARGGITCKDPILYVGGPMMGEVTESLDHSVTKTSSGLFLLPRDNFLIQKRSIPMRHILRQAQSACTNCMQCTEACPRYLLGHKIRPHKIMNAVTLGLSYQSDVFLEAYLCMFCGMCEFACPMWLSPKRVYADVRAGLIDRDIRYPRGEQTYSEHPMRHHRRVPSSRLVRRYQLSRYSKKLPIEIESLETWKVRIPTLQGLGRPADPTVDKGDWVKESQLIGEIPEGKLGARIHFYPLVDCAAYCTIKRE
jgi:Na+-translocating ferredoxin:NAD+ oxidoreductase RnfC subunit